MSIQIQSRPISNVQASNTSNWNASQNPVVYNIKREDQQITSTEESGGKVIINLLVDLTSELEIGDSLFLESGVYSQGAKITAITATQITTDITFTETSSGGYINFRSNYRVKIDFINPDTGFKLVDKPYRVRTQPNGLLQLDVHERLKPLLIGLDSFDYSVLNLRDDNLSFSFYIEVTEFYDGITPTAPDIIDQSNVIFITLSAKQIGEIHGGNMGEYVPFPAKTVDPENRAKWLTKFDELPMWEGWPFDMQFIYGEQMAGFKVMKTESYLDVNGNEISIANILLDQSQIKGINRLTLTSSLPDDTECIEVSLTNQGTAGEYEASEYAANEYNV